MPCLVHSSSPFLCFERSGAPAARLATYGAAGGCVHFHITIRLIANASSATASTPSLKTAVRYNMAHKANARATIPVTGRMCSRRINIGNARSHAGVPCMVIMSGLLKTRQCWNAYRWPMRMAKAEMARLDTATNQREGSLCFDLSFISFIFSSERLFSSPAAFTGRTISVLRTVGGKWVFVNRFLTFSDINVSG